MRTGFYSFTDSAVARGIGGVYCSRNNAHWHASNRVHFVSVPTEVIRRAIADGSLCFIGETLPLSANHPQQSDAACHTPPPPPPTLVTFEKVSGDIVVECQSLPLIKRNKRSFVVARQDGSRLVLKAKDGWRIANSTPPSTAQ